MSTVRTIKRSLTGLGVCATSAYWLGMSSQSQLLGPFPGRGPRGPSSHRRQVALTFDDGPNEPYTSRIAAILEQRGARATFFQVGRAVRRYPDVSKELIRAGHVIGNHSYSHDFGKCLRATDIADETERAQHAIVDAIGVMPALYRPPWLVRTPATFAVLRRASLLAVSGTFCHPLEVTSCPPSWTATRAVARTSPGRILIFHDGYNGRGADRSATVDAVARVVDTLGERGWMFTTVDKLLEVDPYQQADRT